MYIVPFLADRVLNRQSLTGGAFDRLCERERMYIDKETSRLRLIVNWIVDIVVVISIAWFVVFSLGTQITMTGQSMEPVLSQDEVVLMNRLSVRFGKIKRFDIVVFEKEENKFNIRRVVGLPGETVQIKDGFLYIDDERIEAENGLGQAALAGIAENPVLLGRDEYFLLGDNRENSEDSRFASVGNVAKRQIKGKVWLKIRPIRRFGLVRPVT